jgi:peroxiredoxin
MGTRTWRTAALLLVLAALAGWTPTEGRGPACSPGWEPQEGRGWIGRSAPEWRGIEWLQGGPLRLQDLSGRVVLLRFWLTDCPYCRRSSEALRAWSARYGREGLVVVGIHHPKSEEARDRAVVAAGARALGFEFPIGIDDAWTTARAYGVGTDFTRFTSVSFLIGRDGVVRFVHDGGEYHKGGGPGHEECAAARDALEAAIEDALRERPAAAS